MPLSSLGTRWNASNHSNFDGILVGRLAARGESHLTIGAILLSPTHLCPLQLPMKYAKESPQNRLLLQIVLRFLAKIVS